ncbi:MULTISPECIES: hypothetical protein [unclassified Streptomyces]|uniref:hypothetical protein n=1 Tax=unclassified Streptomyces TaxID=2593676 RepID=UPI00131EC10C|nr:MULTISPECIES: hypothetical protein [unclassified Streptomyces]MYX23247.1 hypothetical protein [Streptomyces sp. SID8380]
MCSADLNLCQAAWFDEDIVFAAKPGLAGVLIGRFPDNGHRVGRTTAEDLREAGSLSDSGGMMHSGLSREAATTLAPRKRSGAGTAGPRGAHLYRLLEKRRTADEGFFSLLNLTRTVACSPLNRRRQWLVPGVSGKGSAKNMPKARA